MTDDEVKFGAEDFAAEGVDQAHLRSASEVYLALLTACNGDAQEVVLGNASPSAE